MWRTFLYPLLMKIAPRIWKALVDGKPLHLINFAELMDQLDKDKLERKVAAARTRERLGLPPDPPTDTSIPQP